MQKGKRDPLTEVSPALAVMKAIMEAHDCPNKPKPKRKPLLIDEMLALKEKNFSPILRGPMLKIQAKLSQAKVFSFDEEAACYAAEFMMKHPKDIAKNLDFAVPPYKTMFIEFPYPKFYDLVSPPEYRGRSNLPPAEDDADVGYLIDGHHVYVMSRAVDSPKYPMALPLRYRLNQPLALGEELSLAVDLSEPRLGIDALFWGSLYTKLTPQEARSIRARHGMEFWYGNKEMSNEAITYVLKTSAGDLRNVLGFLLFLDRTREVQVIEDVPPTGGFIRAKQRTLVRHNTVRLKLDPGPILKRSFSRRGGTHASPEAHDVRGHWAHNRTYHAAQHEHDMKKIGANRFICTICNGLKWWRKEHHRGEGTTNKIYEVNL